MNKKDIKGIIFFIIFFIIICLISIILYSLGYFLWYIWLRIETQGAYISDIINGLALIAFFLAPFIVLITQIGLAIYASIWIIKKSKNQALLKLFDTWQTPTLVLLFFCYFDMLVKHYYLDEYDYTWYAILFSPLIHFIPIFMVSMLNNLRLYLKSHNIFKNKKPE